MAKKVLENSVVTEIDKKNYANELVKLLQKDYKQCSLGQSKDVIGWIPSGNSALDYLISNQWKGGGWPRGHIIELYGLNSTGKSMLGYFALMNNIKYNNGISILIYCGEPFNLGFYELLGGDASKLILFPAENTEEVYEYINKTLQIFEEKNIKQSLCIVWDSLAATPTRSLQKNQFDKSDMGKRGKANSQGMALVAQKINKLDICFIVVNQLRATMDMFGPDMDTVGGQATKYASSIRINLSKGKLMKETISTDEDKDEKKKDKDAKIIGIKGKLAVEKTRFSPPFRILGFDIYYYHGGMSPFSGLFDTLVKHTTMFQPAMQKTDATKLKSGWYIYKDFTFDEKTFYKEVLPKCPEFWGAYEYAKHESDDVEYDEEETLDTEDNVLEVDEVI